MTLSERTGRRNSLYREVFCGKLIREKAPPAAAHIPRILRKIKPENPKLRSVLSALKIPGKKNEGEFLEFGVGIIFPGVISTFPGREVGPDVYYVGSGRVRKEPTNFSEFWSALPLPGSFPRSPRPSFISARCVPRKQSEEKG